MTFARPAGRISEALMSLYNAMSHQRAAPVPRQSAAAPYDYQLIREIGVGRNATVYEARRNGSDTPIALKKLRPEDARRELHAITRLQRSAYVAPLIDHPFARDESVFLPFPLFAAELREIGPGTLLPAALATLVLLPVAKLCRDCERAGLVLTDLNPRNIMLRSDGRRTVVQTVDLGSAITPGPSPPSTVEVTDSWVAPELHQPIVHLQTSSWSFGSIVRWATGIRWFDADVESEEILAAAPWLGPRLSSLVAGCTASAPERRPPPSEVAEELRRILRDSSGRRCRDGHACFASATDCSCGREVA